MSQNANLKTSPLGQKAFKASHHPFDKIIGKLPTHPRFCLLPLTPQLNFCYALSLSPHQTFNLFQSFRTSGLLTDAQIPVTFPCLSQALSSFLAQFLCHVLGRNISEPCLGYSASLCCLFTYNACHVKIMVIFYSNHLINALLIL